MCSEQMLHRLALAAGVASVALLGAAISPTDANAQQSSSFLERMARLQEEIAEGELEIRKLQLRNQAAEIEREAVEIERDKLEIELETQEMLNPPVMAPDPSAVVVDPPAAEPEPDPIVEQTPLNPFDLGMNQGLGAAQGGMAGMFPGMMPPGANPFGVPGMGGFGDSAGVPDLDLGPEEVAPPPEPQIPPPPALRKVSRDYRRGLIAQLVVGGNRVNAREGQMIYGGWQVQEISRDGVLMRNVNDDDDLPSVILTTNTAMPAPPPGGGGGSSGSEGDSADPLGDGGEQFGDPDAGQFGEIPGLDPATGQVEGLPPPGSF